MPLISIIMPCLNGERHIQTAIDSVLAQTFGDFELIVVDNGSTDRTPEIQIEFLINMMTHIGQTGVDTHQISLRLTQAEGLNTNVNRDD